MRRAAIVALLATFTAPAIADTSGPAGSADPVVAIQAMDRNLAEMDSHEQDDKAELGRIGTRVATTHAHLVAHGRAYYRLTRAGLLPIGGGFDELVTHAMHVERARRVVAGDIREERDLHARAEALQRDLERLARDRVALSTQRQAMQAARAAEDEDRRRQAAFDRAFQTSTGAGADYVPVYGGGSVVSDMPAGGFASARGRLLFPVVARADIRPAHREGTGGPGLEILAPAGTVVRAVFSARVAFADRYGPYGRIVILDHGDRYYTVSGNLDSIDVKIGQDVGAGDRIGTVGDDGAGSMLYFEVRHGSQTVPPAPWLGL
jgi:murein DD-endopeptidase MepM/ murein hydrolase activator NlpD